MDNFIEILKENQGWFEGHTTFRDGSHGNGWIQKGSILRNPRVLDMVTHYQATQIASAFPDANLIVGPIVSGALLGAFVAKHLGYQLAVVQNAIEIPAFHGMYIPKPPRKIVLVDDILFTGKGMKVNTQFLREQGLVVDGISVWVNRKGPVFEGLKVISILDQHPFEHYDADSCPLCLGGTKVLYEDIRE